MIFIKRKLFMIRLRVPKLADNAAGTVRGWSKQVRMEKFDWEAYTVWRTFWEPSNPLKLSNIREISIQLPSPRVNESLAKFQRRKSSENPLQRQIQSIKKLILKMNNPKTVKRWQARLFANENPNRIKKLKEKAEFIYFSVCVILRF